MNAHIFQSLCLLFGHLRSLNNYQEYIDGLILKALREDDEQPLTHLFTFYYNRLLRAGLRWCADTYITEECIQDVFFDLWHYRHRLGEIVSLEAYLKTALRRRIFKKLKRMEMADAPIEEAASVMTTESYEEILILRQSDEAGRLRLQKAMQTLSDRQREIILLKYFEELSYKDIAEQFDMTIGAVYKLLHDAVKKLKFALLPAD